MDHGFIDITATRGRRATAMDDTNARGSIDAGATIYLLWNRAVRIPVAPGPHTVEVWVYYETNADMGRNSVPVDIAAGRGVSVTWKRPLTILRRGAMTAEPGLQPDAIPIDQVPQEPGGEPELARGYPPGWHPDPTGRFPHRWWDGTTWTDDVSSGGANPGKDPEGPR